MAVNPFRTEAELNEYLARMRSQKEKTSKARRKAPSPHKRSLSEADITLQIRGVLKAARIFHWKQWQGPMSQPKGVSDILGWKTVNVSDLVKAGITRVAIPVAIEVKKPGGPVRPEQVAFIEQINRDGGIGFIARSPEEVIEKLGLQGKITPLFKAK